MCGLAGILDASGSARDTLNALVLRMVAQLVHRGPDGEGVWVEDGIALGHRRLSIIDLSPAGAQPMQSACGRFIIAFNGEIYNHLDIRRKLEESGAAPTWRGHSDTETLLAAITVWGLDATLQMAAGMFVIAIWDRTEKRLFLARDRMGEKPLYWGWAGSTLIFGSELKALRQYPGFPNDVCRAALVQYLRFGYVPAPRSIHPGVYKLEPGCVLEIEGAPPQGPPRAPLRPGDRFGSLSIRRYWSLNETIETGGRSLFTDEKEAIVSLEGVLQRAVGRQMVADVPLGAFLSGGIDSSLIVALMQAQSQRPVRTFTVGFENPAFNEAPNAAAVARHLGTEHTELLVTERQALNVIPHLPDFYDEPFGDSSQIPTYLVCRAARAHVTVALSGDAGDELFGGYNRYVLGPTIWNSMARFPLPVRRLLAGGALSVSVETWDRIGKVYNWSRPPSTGISSLGDKVHRVAQRLHEVANIDALHRSMISIWTNPSDLLHGPIGDEELKLIFDDPLPAVLNENPAGRMMAQDMRSYLPDDILCKVDRAAMGSSLETRVPFLDPEVITLSSRLPMQMKVRDGTGKWALRQVLYRHVPRELIERPKMGFSIPIGEWLRGPLRDWAEDLLATDKLAADDLLDPAPIRRAWAEHVSRQHDWTQRLWTILMLQAWRERWR